MIALCNTLLQTDTAHETRLDIGTSIKLTLVTDKNTDVVIAPILTTMSTASSIEVLRLVFYNFLISFLIYDFNL